MRERTLRPVVVVLLAMLAAASASATTQARISGQVLDSQGRPIVGAKISITCAALPTFSKEVVTDDNGHYRVLILDATKAYQFRIEAEGFMPTQERVKVRTGSMDNEIDFKLSTRRQAEAAQQQKILEQPGFKQLDEAAALLDQGAKQEARAKLLEATAAKPDLLQAWIGLADVEYQLEDWAAALEHARKCLELDGASNACLAIAANAANKLGDDDAYVQYMARYQELNPDDPATLFNQAVEFLNAMDDEKARPILKQCLDADPDFPKCLFEYGMLLLRSGDLEGAKAKLEHYLEVAPEGDDAATARETIKYL